MSLCRLAQFGENVLELGFLQAHNTDRVKRKIESVSETADRHRATTIFFVGSVLFCSHNSPQYAFCCCYYISVLCFRHFYSSQLVFFLFFFSLHTSSLTSCVLLQKWSFWCHRAQHNNENNTDYNSTMHHSLTVAFLVHVSNFVIHLLC